MAFISTPVFVVFIGILVSLLIAGVGVFGPAATARKQLNARAARLNRRTPDRDGRTEPAGIRKRDAQSNLPFLDSLARKILPRPQELRHRLARAGLSMSLGTYGACGVMTAAVTATALSIAVDLPWGAIAAFSMTAGLALPHMTVSHLARRRIRRFNGLFPDAIDLIVRGLRSGLPISETIAAVGREMADPIGVEFDAVADAVRLGQSLEAALWEATARLDTPEFKFFVISLSIQRETGGNLAETLENLSDILRRRGQMRLKIRAMSSEARASAMILGSLPFIMFAIIYVINPDYEAQLLTDPRGKMMLLAAGGIMSMGIAVMHKMVRFEI